MLHKLDTLRRMFDNMYTVQSDSKKEELNAGIMDYFADILEDPVSIGIRLDTLDKIGKLYSDDERLMVITWNLPYADGMHAYFGLFRYHDRKQNILKVQRLEYKGFPYDISEKQILVPEKWYGALYYSIITTRQGKEVFYTLLGYDFHTPLTNRKIIEVIKIDEDLQFKLGAPIFMINGKNKKRLVFEYAQDIVMNIKFNESLDMIVYDHLVPVRPSLQESHEFYGPDGTFDGLKFNNGRWEHYSDVDLRKTNAF